MRKKTQDEKFDDLVYNFFNGNIGDTRAKVKKLSKETRKSLYLFVRARRLDDNTQEFFFSLI